MSAYKAPLGFKFATLAAGFKKKGRKDLALLVSSAPASAAGVFTLNLFKAAPVLVGQKILDKNASVRGVLINTGQANACTGGEGLHNCLATLELSEKAAALPTASLLPASTGVIGAQLKMELWRAAVPDLAADLGRSSHEDFATAIMTTDRFPKISGAEVQLAGGPVRLLGMAKGAGMICPNMATMLAVLLCDADVAPESWRAIVKRGVADSFNRVTVDGDTSTNDTLYALANGAAGVRAQTEDLPALEAALTRVLRELAFMLVQDGEGATKVMQITVRGARDAAEAELVARAVGHSPLVKTAMYGHDANWGRIVAAAGRSGANFRPEDLTLNMCGVELFRAGQPVREGDDPVLVEALKNETTLPLQITLGGGPGAYELFASDLTHNYVSLNADYRS